MAHCLFTSTGVFMMDPIEEVDGILGMKRYLAEEEEKFISEMLAAGFELDFVDIYEVRFKKGDKTSEDKWFDEDEGFPSSITVPSRPKKRRNFVQACEYFRDGNIGGVGVAFYI